MHGVVHLALRIQWIVVADNIGNFSRVQLRLGHAVAAREDLALPRADLADGLGEQAVRGGEVHVLRVALRCVCDGEAQRHVARLHQLVGLGARLDLQQRRFLRQRCGHNKRPRPVRRKQSGRETQQQRAYELPDSSNHPVLNLVQAVIS